MTANNRIVTLIVAILLWALMLSSGCERASVPSAPVFRLDVQDVADGSDNRAVLLLIQSETPGSMSVDGPIKHSSTALLESDGAYEGSVALLGTRIAPGEEDEAYIQVLSRPQTANGSFAGGAVVYNEPLSTQLDDVFLVTAESGEYPLNTPIEIAQEQGQPITLTVGEPTK